MAFAAPDTDLDEKPQGFSAPESDLSPAPGFTAPQADIETHAKGLLAQPDYDPASHVAQLDPNDPDIESHYQAYKQKQNAPMGAKIWDAAKTAYAPSTAIEAAKGVSKFVAGLGGTTLHSALGQAENIGARISSAVGNDKLAEDLAQRATTNKAESVIGGQIAEKSITGTVEHIAGPVRRALQEGVNADTGYSADRQDQLLRDKFATAVQDARDAQQLQLGRPLDTGAVAWLARKSEGEEPSAAFGPERLESMGARPVSPFVTGMVGATVDPNNLILSKAGNVPGAGRIAGTALKGIGAVGEAGARMTASAIQSAAKSRLANLAAKTVAAAAAFHPMAAVASIIPGLKVAAAGAGTWAGAKLAQAGFGALKEAGGEMLGAAPVAGQGWARSVIKESIKGAGSTAIGMVPINALESEGDPSEFARGEINAGVFGGALGAAGGAKNSRSIAARGHYAQTVKAGEAVNFNDAADQAHQAVMQNLPQQSRDVINFARGQFDGATTPDGKPIRVQAVDDATFQQQTGQSSRGVYFNDGTLLINAGHTAPDGTFHPKSPEALNQTLAHEGKHAIDQAHKEAQPELYKDVFESLKQRFTNPDGTPTREFGQWIQGQVILHIKDLMRAGMTADEAHAKTNDLRQNLNYWLNEASADIGQGLVTGQDLGSFMLTPSIASRIYEAVTDAAAKHGIQLPQSGVSGTLGVPEAVQATRAIRNQLYAAGAEARGRIENPAPASTPNPTPVAPAAPPSPVSPENQPVTPAAPISPPAPQALTPQQAAQARIARRAAVPGIRALFGGTAADAQIAIDAVLAESPTHLDAPEAIVQAVIARANRLKAQPQVAPPLSPTPEANSNNAPAPKAPGAGEPQSAEPPSPLVPAQSTAEEAQALGGTTTATAEHEVPVTPSPNQPLPPNPNGRAPEQPSPNAAPTGVPETNPGVPDAPAIATALQNAESTALQSPEYTRKRGGKSTSKEQAQAAHIKAARISALYDLLPETGPGLHRSVDPDTLELSYEGTIDPQNPLHSAILRESGLTPAHVAVLESAQGRIGTGVYLRDYNSAAQELGPAGETEQSAEQRNAEYKKSRTAPEKGQRRGAVSKQDKAVTILGVKGTKDGVNLVTLDHDKFFDNTRKILDSSKPLNPEHPIYTADPKQAGKLLAQAFQDIAENNANGWKSRGDAPQKSFPDSPVKVTPGYKGKIVDRFLANVINMALHNRTGKPPTEQRGNTELAARKFGKRNAQSKEIAGLADINNRPLMEDGESNFLRATLERRGFEVDKQIKPVISNIRPDLIEGGIADAPTHGKIVHEHGFDVPAGELTIKGRPSEKAVAGNFLPEDLTKNQVGTSNLDASIQKNIDDAKMLNPSDPASFLRKMAATALTQGKEEAATNFEAAAKQVVQEGAKARFMPDTGKPGESKDNRENLAREAESAGVVLSTETLKGLMARDPATMTKVRARIRQETGKDAQFLPSLSDIRDEWKAQGIENFMSEKEGVINLSEIRIPKEERGKGIGTRAMQKLTDYADATGQTISLSPSKDFGASSVARLKDFYKRFGFVENKGRRKDFRISESMIREPKQKPAFMPGESNLTKNQVARPDYRAAARARIQKREGSFMPLEQDLDAAEQINKLGERKIKPQALGLPYEEFEPLRDNTEDVKLEIPVSDIKIGRDELNKIQLLAANRLFKREDFKTKGVSEIHVVPSREKGKYVVAANGNHRAAILMLTKPDAKIPVTLTRPIGGVTRTAQGQDGQRVMLK